MDEKEFRDFFKQILQRPEHQQKLRDIFIALKTPIILSSMPQDLNRQMPIGVCISNMVATMYARRLNIGDMNNVADQLLPTFEEALKTHLTNEMLGNLGDHQANEVVREIKSIAKNKLDGMFGPQLEAG